MTREELNQLEAAFALPHKLSGNALAARVAADMITWAMLQREIEERARLLDSGWEPEQDRESQNPAHRRKPVVA